MAKYPFIVDGQDFTDLFHKYGYEVTYEFREGENGGLMCSGEEQRDLLAIKPTIVRYFDPWTGAEKTITAHPTVDTVSVLLDDSGTHWWRGFRVTMRAK